MRVVFIVTSFWSYGELLIAKQFAQNIITAGDHVLFIVPPTHKENVKSSGIKYMSLIPNSRKLNQIIFVEVREKFHPDLVILSDFLNYNFADKHYGILREDLDLFQCKLATFDNFDWTLPRKYMDTYGFISDIPKKVKIEDYGIRIIPCPIANPSILKREGEYRYSVVTRRSDLNEQKKNQLRKQYRLQVDSQKKIILVSNAKWQETYAKHENIDKFISLSNHIFEELLLYLAKKNFVIFIGKIEEKFKNNPNIRVLNSMLPEKFENFTMMADLFIGKNITSTSMIKIALAGIPCVNIINSISSKGRIKEYTFSNYTYQQELEAITLYKYLMYPVGWYEFLYPVFKENPYGNIIQCCEQFEIGETVKRIEELLYLEKAKKQIQREVNQLNDILDELQTPSQIIKSII